MCFDTEVIGNATLYHGDALEILPALQGGFAAVLCDPPYCSGGVTVAEKARDTSSKYQSSEHKGLYPEFAGDARDQRSFLTWSMLWLGRARALAAPGALIAVFSDWRQLPTTTDALQCAGWVWRGIIPWDKTESSRPQKGRYRHQAEFVIWGTNGARPFAGPIAPGAFRMPIPRPKHHMAGKPVALMEGLLMPVEGAVLDPFMGSGTVGLACAARGLPYVGIEFERAYFEIAKARLKQWRSDCPAETT
ncbi:DNA-methyltransferase [Ancylobacter defluvii]|uniref:Methyltransferase n=1 Tax=Ancylobacter defluvii TaxID=1282440 RepID=A0A9W6K0X6_9HYPH|nr:DNA methyltransferase [Ancylobacter defluvii]MBS7586388.1 site-specific DNA-methyltransferase [Ancylobacter defluvii]GLK85670.1 methyltransferase [Ancylobacter defluvii]